MAVNSTGYLLHFRAGSSLKGTVQKLANHLRFFIHPSGVDLRRRDFHASENAKESAGVKACNRLKKLTKPFRL